MCNVIGPHEGSEGPHEDSEGPLRGRDKVMGEDTECPCEPTTRPGARAADPRAGSPALHHWHIVARVSCVWPPVNGVGG